MRILPALAMLSALSMALLAQTGPSLPTLEGCLAKGGKLSSTHTKGLPLYRRLVKVADAGGTYRAALEAEGYALKDLLERAEVKKKVDDGFDRPLDTFLTVKGRDGRQVVLSYSEIAMAGDGGPLLVAKSRLLFPHHHAPLKAGTNDPTVFLGPAQRDRLNLASCTSCHNGDPLLKLSVPKGWLLVVPSDGFGGRFVEDVASLTLHQVGSSVKKDKDGTKNTVVEVPELVEPDGSRLALTPERYAAGTSQTHADATYGMGRGFHGHRTWVGKDLADLLRPLLPPGSDPGQALVTVTAADGYRVTFSGTEVFRANPGRNVMITDRINGKPLGPGSGKYHIVSKGDFYIDRDVRMVKEIRLSFVK